MRAEPLRPLGRLLLLIAAGLLLFLAAGFWAATRTPEVVRMERVLEGLPPGPPLRLVLLSDPHAGGIDMPASRLRRIVRQVNALEPDLVLLAGDYLALHLLHLREGGPAAAALAPLAGLEARLGVLAVPGNHDGPAVARLLRARRVPRLLVNRWVEAGPIVVAGLDSAAHAPDLGAALGGIPPGRPILLLLHEPEHLLWLPRPEAPRQLLALAGHTHGGQVWLGPLRSPMEWLGEPFPCRRGACRLNGWDVIVTSGLGTSKIPVRIGVRPEILLILLYPSTGRKSGTER